MSGMAASQEKASLKAFVSESELAERRAERQRDWERVRSADQPLEAPEEEYDPRSLYDRLQAHKDKKQAEFEEAHKLKNMIKGLDNDEIQFLDLVDKTKEEMEAKILKEEGREIEEYRRAVATLAEEEDQRKQQEIKNAGSAATPSNLGITAFASTGASSTMSQNSSQRRSQMSLLSGAVKRKSTDKSEEERANKSDDKGSKKLKSEVSSSADAATVPLSPTKAAPSGECDVDATNAPPSTAIVCLGVLPGLGVYSDSSDSEGTSGSDIEDDAGHYDLLGRPRWMHNAPEHTDKAQHSAGKA